MKHFYFLLVFIFCILTVHAQEHQYYFNRLDINNGLSQNSVNAILQDDNGFIWIGTKDGLNRYDGRSFKIFRHNIEQDYGLRSSCITHLNKDRDGNIWIGTDIGLFIYDPKKEMFKQIPIYDEEGVVINKPVHALKSDKDGYVWIVLPMNGVFCYNPNTKKIEHPIKEKRTLRTLNIDNTGTVWFSWYDGKLFYSEDKLKTVKPFLYFDENNTFKKSVISSICFSDYNILYIGTEEDGIAEINLITSEIKKIKISDSPNKKIFVHDILQYSDKELWIASESGLYIYNIYTREYKNLQSVPLDPYSISDNAIYSLYKDIEGGVWVGSYFGGISYLSPSNSNFEKFYYSNSSKGLKGRRVREICKGKDHIIWIGTEDAGLYSFNTVTKEFIYFTPSREFSNVHGLLLDNDDLWVSTFSNGIKVIDTKTGKIKKSYIKDGRPGSLNNSYIFVLCKTKTGRIYLGSMYGLQYYDKLSDKFVEVAEVTGGRPITDIKEDSHGNLWVSTTSNGVYKYNMRKNEWKNYSQNQKQNSLPFNKVLSIFEDSNKQVWLTTEGAGFCKFIPDKDIFISYNTSNGLPSDVVFQIIEDQKDFFWITTNHGLAKFNPKTESVEKVYTVANGLLSNQFNYKSSYKLENEIIYFGSIDGLISFSPEKLSNNEYIPPVYITDFSIWNKKVLVGEKHSPLSKSIILTDSITLKHNQNSFSFQIASLSYQAPQMNQLLYKLDGVDKNWRNYTIKNSDITYSNINPGNYVFRVKGSNEDGVWNDKERLLYIHISPPFYLTNTAFAIYAILFILTTVSGITFLMRKNKKKQMQYKQVVEREKERELYDSKINFFTHVAHEIRTPLTLIKAPLDNILANKDIRVDMVEDLSIMKQNTDRLLDLTNQLLDFRKTEKEGFSLNLSEYNVTDIVRTTVHRFSSLAKQRNFKFELNISPEDFYAHVDKEAFIKILSNLLNNALKYADTYICITLNINTQNNTFQIQVINDGSVVPIEMRENIFKPFFRYIHDKALDIQGTGIGLSLSRSLAELHQGSLIMEKERNINIFTLNLPISHNKEETIQLRISKDDEDNNIDNETIRKTNVYTILVVEDNDEMNNFIKRQISKNYHVLTAKNGIEALTILNEKYITLIISDIMMPQMDGFELCKRTKNDINFSHIPFILLTAKINVQSKIEGMDIGADAYIEKPFSTAFLFAVIANLINSREKLREAFIKNPLIIANTVVSTKADTEFLSKLREIIHLNLSNSDFRMEDIAEAMFMSRANFYRKIKGVLNMVPNDYLRLERLKVAAQLLIDGKYKVNEICYMVGFSSPSYFSKCFQSQFGVRPREFVSNNKTTETTNQSKTE